MVYLVSWQVLLEYLIILSNLQYHIKSDRSSLIGRNSWEFSLYDSFIFLEFFSAFRYSKDEAPKLKFEALNILLAQCIVDLALSDSLFVNVEAVLVEGHFDF